MSAKLTVLVVENDEGSRFVLEVMLGETFPSAKPIFLKSGEEALARIQAGDIDLVVSENFLSGKMTGVELWQKIQTLGTKPKFVLVSGADPLRIFPKTLKHRPKFLAKPFNKEAMQAALLEEADSNESN